ncbi:MAG: putative PEP-binding protein, partial [Phycisphaerales bacterium]
VLLVRAETRPDDVHGMLAAKGILTSRGGRTSHAALVARQFGKPAVVGVSALDVDVEARQLTVKGRVFKEGDVLSLDGTTGEVFAGEVPTMVPAFDDPHLLELLTWADAARTLGVWANADSLRDAERARRYGAEGIGLCRTEHMFFDGERIKSMRKMILADSKEMREKYLAELLPHQRDDFVGLFTAMKGMPVTIRLIDPPLHEFLPHEDKQQAELAKSMGVTLDKVKHRVNELHEANPMLGHRGCRLCVTYPEILVMQVRAIVEATLDCVANGIKAMPEIMIPLVGTRKELAYLRQLTLDTINNVRLEKGWQKRIDIPIGTMIEVPRAAVTANEIAEQADFFSFGTNDLTQMTFGFSRDDINNFLPDYLHRELLDGDPFQSLDQGGVGQLVKMGLDKGRATNSKLKVGICGEHGGDPKSVHFFHRAGLDYVSCSPFRVPIARLAAAQAVIMEESAK